MKNDGNLYQGETEVSGNTIPTPTAHIRAPREIFPLPPPGGIPRKFCAGVVRNSLFKMSQFRNVMFTDYDIERKNFWLGLVDETANFVIFQKEKCPSTGKLHLQGYMELEKRIRFGALKKLVGEKVHLEKRKGNQGQAIKYCSKEESRVEGPWEAGTKKAAGKRSDLEAVKEAIDEGKTEVEIADEFFGSWTKYHRSFREYKRLKVAKEDGPKEVSVFWGEAGSGKTRKVYDTEGYGIWSKPQGRWFDGYDGQEAVLFDDYTGDLELGLFLKVLDRYPMSVEVKGAYVPWRPKRVYITSNLSPEEWYPKAKKEQHLAIRRRISSIVRFKRGLTESMDGCDAVYDSAVVSTFNADPCI